MFRIILIVVILVALPWRLEAGDRITVGGYTFEAALDSMTIYDSAWQFVRYDPILTWRLVEPEPEVINEHRVYVYPITGSRSPDTSCRQIWFQKNIIKEKIERLYKLYDELTKPPAKPEPDSMKYQGGDGDLTVKDIADLVWEKADTGRVIEVWDSLILPLDSVPLIFYTDFDHSLRCENNRCVYKFKKSVRLTNCQYDIDTTYSYDHNVRTGENSNFRYSLDTVAVYCDTMEVRGNR